LDGLEPGEMWGELAEGTFLFADISGFTALADRLSALPDGTEKLTGLINDYFTTMLQVVAQSCREVVGRESEAGDPVYDLLKFGGDAMLLLFSGPDHARLAVHAAMRMQQRMADVVQGNRALGAASLGMHIGINSGRFLDAHVGTPRTMKKVEVGRALNLTARAEEIAASGQIVIGPGTYEALRDWVAVRPVTDDFYLLDGSLVKDDVSYATPPASFSELVPPGILDDLVASLDAMVPYLAPGLLEKIVLDPHAPVVWADLKLVTVLFANLIGLDDMVEALSEKEADQVTNILDRYLGAVIEIVTRYEGTFNKLDLAQEGDKLLILFGAPHAHEDDPQRAVRAALEMQEALRPFTELSTRSGTNSLRLRVGIHSGSVFAGNVGSPTRKEYTVMGDVVNLAARLMAAAEPGQVIVTQETQRRLGQSCRWARVGRRRTGGQRGRGCWRGQIAAGRRTGCPCRERGDASLARRMRLLRRRHGLFALDRVAPWLFRVGDRGYDSPPTRKATGCPGCCRPRPGRLGTGGRQRVGSAHAGNVPHPCSGCQASQRTIL
jgi:class 3 adenylate cyclase